MIGHTSSTPEEIKNVALDILQYLDESDINPSYVVMADHVKQDKKSLVISEVMKSYLEQRAANLSLISMSDEEILREFDRDMIEKVIQRGFILARKSQLDNSILPSKMVYNRETKTFYERVDSRYTITYNDFKKKPYSNVIVPR